MVPRNRALPSGVALIMPSLAARPINHVFNRGLRWLNRFLTIAPAQGASRPPGSGRPDRRCLLLAGVAITGYLMLGRFAPRPTIRAPTPPAPT